MDIFLLLVILAMTGWIMITLNEIDKTSTKENQELWRKINNIEMQQNGMQYKVDEVHDDLKAEQKNYEEKIKLEVEERNKED